MLFYGMRLVPFVGARTLVARAFSSIIGPSSQPSACYDEAALSVLRRDGVVSMAPLLTSTQIAEVDAFLRNRELVGHDGTTFHLGQAPAGTQRASYPLTTTLSCPHLFAAVNNPALLAFVESYLGAKPTISAVRIDCTFPPRDGACPLEAQQFHRDYDDWRFVKVFVYISEVDDLGGPHEYVCTSHLRSGRFRATPFHREFIDREYGSRAIERIRGPRGRHSLPIHSAFTEEECRPALFARCSKQHIRFFRHRSTTMRRSTCHPNSRSIGARVAFWCGESRPRRERTRFLAEHGSSFPRVAP